MRELRTHAISHLPFFLVWVGVVVAFAGCYFVLSYIPGHGLIENVPAETVLGRALTALYFSVITGATVGYGDVLPLGISRALAALEGIISFVLLAVFVSRVASRQQNEAIRDIHSLSRDSLFNNFRHGLFIARKDLDKLVEKVDANEPLTERDYKNLRTSFRQMQTQIRNVPQLYAMSSGTIDEDHEELVLDSVERSLRRAREAIDKLDGTGNSCRVDDKCMAELGNVVHATHTAFVTLFKTAYNSENNEAFTEMLLRLEELRARI